MGYNTTVIILNDAAHKIESDPAFPRNLHLGIMKAGSRIGPRGDGQQTVSIGNHMNGCTVVETHHADQTVLVAVGGNHATPVFQSFGPGDHHTEAGQEKLLREWAAKMGFRLVRTKAVGTLTDQ